MEKILETINSKTVSAANGKEALEKLRIENFDIIISDILMPLMDGFQLCWECKRDDKLRNIPFVFYSAPYTDINDEELAIKLGADRFVRKPIEMDEFIRIIQNTVKFARTISLKEKYSRFKDSSFLAIEEIEKRIKWDSNFKPDAYSDANVYRDPTKPH